MAIVALLCTHTHTHAFHVLLMTLTHIVTTQKNNKLCFFVYFSLDVKSIQLPIQTHLQKQQPPLREKEKSTWLKSCIKQEQRG